MASRNRCRRCGRGLPPVCGYRRPSPRTSPRLREPRRSSAVVSSVVAAVAAVIPAIVRTTVTDHRQLGLLGAQRAELAVLEVGELEDLQLAGVVLAKHHQIQNLDHAALDHVLQHSCDLPVELAAGNSTTIQSTGPSSSLVSVTWNLPRRRWNAVASRRMLDSGHVCEPADRLAVGCAAGLIHPG